MERDDAALDAPRFLDSLRSLGMTRAGIERQRAGERTAPPLPPARCLELHAGVTNGIGRRCFSRPGTATFDVMETTGTHPIAEPYREAAHIRLMPGPGELAAIAAFWVGYGLLTLANRIFDQGGPSAAMNGRIIVAAIEALCWTIVTPILFALVGRVDLENSRSQRDRWLRVLLIVLVTVASAALLGLIGRELRETFTPFQGGRGRGGRGGPPDAVRLWFGFFNSLILALGVVAVGVARAYSLRLRSRREQAIQLTNQLTEARLDALRRQLDPHFLFNTLNAIASLVERDPRGVRRMIARLGDLLRHSFEGGHEPEVSLRRELALLDLYVDIVKVRFQDRLTVDIRVDDAVLDALVPTFILQPLVENAVKHGVERRTEGGRVSVEGTREGDALVLRVINDAPGEASLVVPSPTSRTGVGIRNTRARLEQLYGNRQRFTLERNAERGVVAEVRLPFHVGVAAEPRISGPRLLVETAVPAGAQRV